MSGWFDEDSEAAHLAEIEDEDYDAWFDDDDEGWTGDDGYIGEKRHSGISKSEKIAKGVSDNEKHYLKNKAAKVGTNITCAGPMCNKHFVKRQYSQAFCCTHCKDQFWNRREAFFGFRKPVD